MVNFNGLKKGHTLIVWVMVVLLMTLPALYFSTISDEVFDEPRELLILVLGGLAMMLIETRRMAEGRPLLGAAVGTWVKRLLLAVVAWVGLSAVIAVNTSVAWAYFMSFGAVSLIGFAIVGWLEDAPGRRGAVIAGLASLVGLEVAVSLIQRAHLPLLQWAQQTPALMINGNVLPGGFWPYDFMVGLGNISADGQLVGTLGNVNYLGELLVLTVPVLVGAAIATSNTWVRWSLALLVTGAVYALIGTNARGAMIGLLIGAPLAVVSVWGLNALNPRTHWNHPGRRLLVAGTLLIGLLLTGVVGERVVSKFQIQAGADRSVEARLINWQAGLELVKERPLAGTGIGNYKVVNFDRLRASHPTGLSDMVSDNRFLRAHSEPLQLLIELGIVGLLLVVAFGIAWWRHVIRNDVLPPSLRFGILWGTGAILVAGIVGFPLHIPVTAVAFSLILAMGVARSSEAPVTMPARWRVAYTAVGIALLAGLLVLAAQKFFVPQFQAHQQLLAARALYVNGRYSESEVVYRALDRTARYRGVYRIEYIRALVATQRYDEALQVVEASGREGLGFEAMYWKARALWGLGRLAEARATYKEVTTFFTSYHRLHIEAQKDLEAIKRGARPS